MKPEAVRKGLAGSRCAVWAAALALVAQGACRRASKLDLTLAGSTSVQPFAERWAEVYGERSGLTLHVQGGGSTAGVQAVLSGTAQVGMSSRALTPVEATRVHAIVVGRDGIALVVHPQNRVDDLTLDQLRGIYSGKIERWKELGGADARITVITREEGSGTQAAFAELVMDGERFAASALVQDSTGAVRQLVASDPAAIGYISMGLVDASVRAVSLSGAAPGASAIDAGRYPLVRPFLFVLLGEPTGAARDLIDWIKGPEGQALARREGLLPPRE
jgi:phosphate transport system substrate-binding protein